MLASTFRATIFGELLIFKPSFLLPEHPFQVPLNLFVNGEGSFHPGLPLSPVNIQRTCKPANRTEFSCRRSGPSRISGTQGKSGREGNLPLNTLRAYGRCASHVSQ